MYQRLVEDLKKDQKAYEEDYDAIVDNHEIQGSDFDLEVSNLEDDFDLYLRNDLNRAKNRGCTRAQAEEATKVLRYSIQEIIDDIWWEDADDDKITMEELEESCKSEEEDTMSNVTRKTTDKCVNMIKKSNAGIFTEAIITLVAYLSVLCYGYKLSFGWLGKIFRKEMKISEYLKKALPASIIFGCIGWCIERSASPLLEQYCRNQEEENDIQ